MKKAILIVCAVAVVVGLRSAAMGKVNIETVPVGNVGNGADTRYETPGYGAVDYQYNIGKYEVTAGQYAKFLNAVAKANTYGLYDGRMWSNEFGCRIERRGIAGNHTYSVATDWANRPVNFVNWGDAARFTNWLHNGQPRGVQSLSTTENGAYDLENTQGYYGLDGEVADWRGLNDALLAVTRKADWKWAIPTEDEWYKAAYHKNDGVTNNYFDYPMGAGYPSNEVLPVDPGHNANFYRLATVLTIGPPYYRTEVGEFENSESPYGTFDQGGNLFEWNEATMGHASAYRGMRGGSWFEPETAMEASSRWASGNTPVANRSTLGFRVSQVPEPTTLSLLALGGLAMLRRRRSC